MPEAAKFEAPDGYDKLEAMANALDEGGTPEIADHIEAAPDPEPEINPNAPDEPEIPSPDPQGKTGKEGRERDPVTGKYLPKKAEPQKPDAKVESVKPDGKTDTDYEKAKKEEARQKSVLANFEEEKRKTREEHAQREAQLQQRERAIQQANAQQRPEATLHGHTAREYYSAAQAFRKEGDHEQALKCLDAVGQIQRYEQQYYQQSQAQASDAQFKSDMDSYITDHPEYAANSGTPENKMMEQVLAEWPEVYYLKNGFSRAAKIADKLLAAESAADYKTKLEAADKEISSLRGKTQPVAGAPAAQGKPRNILEMPQAEAEAYLQRRAELEDAG